MPSTPSKALYACCQSYERVSGDALCTSQLEVANFVLLCREILHASQFHVVDLTALLTCQTHVGYHHSPPKYQT